MIKIISTTFIIVLFFNLAEAKYIQTCKTKYKKSTGWSEYYTVNVTFKSGSELNKATKSYDYESYSTYAVIFWNQDQVSVILLSSYTGCGSEVTQNCITNKYSNLEGIDQEGRAWEICSKSSCY